LVGAAAQIYFRGKSRARTSAWLCEQVFEELITSNDSSTDQLARLERIVYNLEMAIPTSTVARQFNLKVCPDLQARGASASAELSGECEGVGEGWGEPEESRTNSKKARKARARQSSFFTELSMNGGRSGPLESQNVSSFGEEITGILMGGSWKPPRNLISGKSIESSLQRLVALIDTRL
jgi:hypothetical protein